MNTIKILLFSLLFALVFAGCDGYDGDSYDFSNSLDNYIEFSSAKAISVEPGAAAAFEVVTKSSFSQDVKVAVQIEGTGISETKTVTLKKMTTSIKDSFTIPETTAEGTSFTISIVSATTENGNEGVRLGRISSATTIIKGTVEVVEDEEG